VLALLLGIWAMICHLPGASIKVVSSRLGKSIEIFRSYLGGPTNSLHSAVVFFGNSRFQSCIDPGRFEARLGVPNLKCVNLAQPSMSPWEYDVLLKEAQLDLRPVKLAFVQMDPWMFNQNELNPTTHKPVSYPHEFEVFSSMRERLFIPGWNNKVRLMLNTIPRYSLADIASALTYCRHGANRPPVPYEPPAYHTDPKIAALQRADPDFFPQNISRMHMNDYQFSRYWQNTLERLLSRLAHANIPVIFIHPPVKREYYRYVECDSHRQAEYNRLLAYMADLARRYPFLDYKTPPDCGLDDQAFIDYGHFTKTGCIAFTDLVYESLQDPLARCLGPD